MIRNVWAVGRSYAEHVQELGNAVPTEPLIFLKAGSTTSLAAAEIKLPEWADEIHHEVELVLEFGSDLKIARAAVGLRGDDEPIARTRPGCRSPGVYGAATTRSARSTTSRRKA